MKDTKFYSLRDLRALRGKNKKLYFFEKITTSELNSDEKSVELWVDQY